jgi:heterodisulfide reductase subunit A-like polyferredoxin
VEAKDIPDTVVHASAAASKALSLISKGRGTTEVAVSHVDKTIPYIVRLMCSGMINPNYIL